MSLMDTTDSVPISKLWYNLTITAASVVVTIFIGGIQALGLIDRRLPGTCLGI